MVLHKLYPDLDQANPPVDLDRVAPDLRKLACLWPETDPHPLRWDRCREVFRKEAYRSTYRGLFGSWSAFRSWSDLRSGVWKIMRLCAPNRWSKPLHLEAPLPRDAVIVPLVQDGIVIASAEANRAIKLVYGCASGTSIEREREAIAMAHEAGIGDHVPPIIDAGQTGRERWWICTPFVPNPYPLDQPIIPSVDRHAQWAGWLRQEILPVMQRLYEHSGVQVVRGNVLLSSLEDRIDEHPALFALLESAERAHADVQEDRVAYARIHGSLSARHVHRSRGGWQLIDWGSSLRAPVVADVFKEFWPLDEHSEPFWRWLQEKHDATEAPRAVQPFLDLFIAWQKEWLGLRLDAAAVRFQLLVAVIENYCTQWEQTDLAPSPVDPPSTIRELRWLEMEDRYEAPVSHR